MKHFVQSLLLLWAATTTYVACEKAPLILDISQDVELAERRRFMRRDDIVSTDAIDAQSDLYVDVAIGTPKQTIRMELTTNYGDIIMMSDIDPTCANSNCFWSATFDGNSSSSYKYLDESFDLYITYWNGNSDPLATGDVATETLQLGQESLENVTVLIATNGTLNTAKFGIGYTNIEATQSRYANLPVQLYNENRTNIIGYSIYFDHRNSTKPGRVTFGGVDTGKFYGALATMPIVMSDREYRDTQIDYSNITVWDGTRNISMAQSGATAIIDANTQGLVLPTSAFQALVTQLNITLDSSDNCVVQLDQMNNATTVNIAFGSTEIRIPLADLWWQSNATHAFLLLSDAGSGRVALGMPFFRNAYLVFDLSHNQISLAQFRDDFTADNTTLINQGGVAGLVGYIPSATDNGNSNTNSTTSPSPTATGNTNNGGLSTGAKAGIGVGVTVGVLFVAALLGFFAWRNRRNKRQAREAAAAVAADSSSSSPGKPTPAPMSPNVQEYYADKAELSDNMRDVKHSSYTTAGELEAREQTASPVSELFASPVSADGRDRIPRKPIPLGELE